MGRSDLVRRAMSKKKAAVMAKERETFVHGNAEEGVPGCAANGVDEKTANKIYDEMTDFAKYAFNKSHAACYAVVSYQTAWLKYYYPREYMAALMTSVIDNPGKVAEYIMSCRQMGIKILPPDINEGVGGFSVSGDKIRYGLSAIKSVGKPVIEAIIAERGRGGRFTDLRSFTDRMTGREVNKRTIESFIKAGALDGLGGTRKQLMMVYAQIMDASAQAKKASISGQMSLFDLMGEEEKQEYSIHLPNVGEYPKEQLLTFEKEVLGVYVSGHPLESYVDMMKKNVTATSSDFALDEETGAARLADGANAVIGGMISGITVKYTKKNQAMAFITLEDLVGTVEIIVFPRPYEQYRKFLTEDAKIFVTGHVSVEDEKASRLICDRIQSFDDIPSDVWIQCETVEGYTDKAQELMQLISSSDGKDQIVIYVKEPKAVKRLGARYSVQADALFLEKLGELFGKENVKVVAGKL